VLDILERKKVPIIGRLLHESGIWLLAPEDKRYGQDIIVPRNAIADAKAGQVVAIELTETPSLHSQPLGRVTEVLGEIDDAGMEIEIAVRKYEVPHVFSDEALAQAAALPRRTRRRPQGPHRSDRRRRWSRSTARTRATSTTPSTASRRARHEQGARLAPDRRDRRREPLREARRADRRRCVRARDFGLLPAPGHPDAAGEAFPTALRAQSDVDRLGMVCDMLVSAEGRARRLPVLPGRHPLACPAHLPRWPRSSQHPRPGGDEARPVPHLLDLHDVYARC
jgi:ribonuclease R